MHVSIEASGCDVVDLTRIWKFWGMEKILETVILLGMISGLLKSFKGSPRCVYYQLPRY